MTKDTREGEEPETETENKEKKEKKKRERLEQPVGEVTQEWKARSEDCALCSAVRDGRVRSGARGPEKTDSPREREREKEGEGGVHIQLITG